MTAEPSKDIPFYPLIAEEIKNPPEKNQDLIKISAIIFAAVGGIFSALGALCIAGILPSALFGGTVGILILISAGMIILIPSALVVYFRWSL